MIHSRRDFGSLALALLATREGEAQSQSPTLKSEMYRFEERAAPLPRSFLTANYTRVLRWNCTRRNCPPVRFLIHLITTCMKK